MKVSSKALRQRGFSLMEYALAAVLVAGSMAVLVRQTTDQQNSIKNRAAAQQMQQVLDAENLYVKSNFSALSTAATAGAPVVVNVSGATIGSFQSVQAAGFLPSSFDGQTPYGQKLIMLVRQPIAGQLEVLTTSMNGDTIPDKSLGEIASLIGAPGGFMAANAVGGSTGKVTGSYGGWSASAAAWTNGSSGPTAGHYMGTLAYSSAAISSSSGSYLSRVATGNPADNQMSTAIDMNSNDINNGGGIAANTVSASTSMQAPVYYDSDDVNYYVDANGTSKTHVMTADASVQTPKIYDLDNSAYYLDPNGTSQIHNLNANGNVGVGGNVTATGNVSANLFYPTATAVVGNACSPNGLIAKDSTGAVLACINGAWTKSGSPDWSASTITQSFSFNPGKFTAPSSGVFVIQDATSSTTACLYYGGTGLPAAIGGTIVYDYSGSNSWTVPKSATIPMRAGDTITLKTCKGVFVPFG